MFVELLAQLELSCFLVPLSVTSEMKPRPAYFCIEEEVFLTCEFRAYPSVTGVNWTDEYGGKVHDTSPSDATDVELWTTTLYSIENTQMINTSCLGWREAENGTLDEEPERKDFFISLRSKFCFVIE